MDRHSRFCHLIPARLCGAILIFLGMNVADELAAEPVSFSRDISPILADRCFQCHGHDAHVLQADLRLDRFESAGEIRAPPP